MHLTLPLALRTALVLTASAPLIAPVAAHGVASASPQAPSAETVDFASVRGILEARCLPCHGGDERTSGLSFADATAFTHGGARGPVMRADEPLKSRLLEVIEYGNPDLAMPPTGVLPEEERSRLRAWIEAGAPWPEGEAGTLADPSLHPVVEEHARAAGPWWAYDPLNAPAVPGAEAATHPIDAFLATDWEPLDIDPAAAASPQALLRRASFDLTGLPPREEHRSAFLADIDAHGLDAAWSRVLDRLFSDPAYGEAEARQWLDLVRYAETDGYERDSQKRNMWRYRDWVVRAFNRDLPYDRFVQLQLAGDEYAASETNREVRDDALLATGFFRLPVFDDEPSDREQARSDEHADIVDTVSQVVFGTTMGCARCHDHKADPVSQAEYFSLTAHFRGITRYAKDGTRDVADAPGPGVMRLEERDRLLAENRIAIEAITAAHPVANSTEPIVLVPDARRASPRGGHEWAYRHGPSPDTAWTQPGFEDEDWERGSGGFGRRGTPASVIGTDWHADHIRLRTTFRLESIPDLVALDLHHDDEVRVYLNGTLVYEATGFLVDYAAIQLPSAARDALVVGRNVLAVSCLQGVGGQYIDAGLRSGSFDAEARLAWIVKAEALAAAGDETAQRLGALLEARSTLEAAPITKPYPAHVGFEYGAVPSTQHVELRGSVHALGDVVEPGVPAAWLAGSKAQEEPYSLDAVKPIDTPFGPSSGRRRHLAEWAFDGGTHITARVEANRIWQFLFGRGLCPTPGDFGRLGELPTHEELLDYLSAQLVERSWSRKSLQRFIMESDAYRRSTRGPEASYAADPRDRLYWRFPPRRLTAEEYRDAVLATSGELVLQTFGPWVYPPLAAEVLATASRPDAAWGQSSPKDAARRSLYVHVKRSLRHPLLASLDQPDPDIACPSRFPTNVPTQALLTLNGEFAQRQASALAKRLMDIEGEPERLATAIERAFGREAEPEELERALAFLRDLESQDNIRGERALAVFALALFNRNEFVWLD